MLWAPMERREIMQVGCARNSTIEQEAGFEAQLRQLKAAGCDKVFAEHVSANEQVCRGLRFLDGFCQSAWAVDSELTDAQRTSINKACDANHKVCESMRTFSNAVNCQVQCDLALAN